ncbi:MAG: hypothetical protein M1820_009540 [Bogoriella megaspora]|nr:MAG: hypothetical protein M1820_009540 [Bogoriella megaspora]
MGENHWPRLAQCRVSLAAGILLLTLSSFASASLGDRLPDFRDCVQVCVESTCENGQYAIPLQRRLLLWTCPSECDYTCQHVITDTRLAREPEYLSPILQFHGKWPFYRFLGMQEPFSVVFSLFNYLAHDYGLQKLRERIPREYSLRKYYVAFGYFGLASWIFSMIFHTRDFNVTEKLDYFAAGASVLYGLYFAPIRIFRLDKEDRPEKASVLRVWTALCIIAYVAHISYLGLWRFDYTYNMAANVVVGVIQNIMWSAFSVYRYRKLKVQWTAWPGLIVAWIVLAMSLELLDFPPWGGMVDAHALWHLGTVGPTIWWYSFLIKDAEEDLQGKRLKK